MAGKALLTVSRDERERARLMSEYKYITDNQSKMVQALKRNKKQVEKKTMEAAKQEFLSQLKSGKSIEELIKLYS